MILEQHFGVRDALDGADKHERDLALLPRDARLRLVVPFDLQKKKERNKSAGVSITATRPCEIRARR